jgi:hypothetical protein
MDPIVCASCGVRFPVNTITTEQRSALKEQYYYQLFDQELQMLRKVEAFYHRHPSAVGRITNPIDRAMFSTDPTIRAKLMDGVPFDKLDLPAETLPPEWSATEEDAEIVEYLKHHNFDLQGRMGCVSEKIGELKGAVGIVKCPSCSVGTLQVNPEDWDEFTKDSAVTWYWPDWHSFETNGTLKVKASGWAGDSHWNGAATFAIDNPDYEFWCWMIKQVRFHRLVEEKELPAIREEWSQVAK